MTACDHLAVRGLEARELGRPDPHLATCTTCQAELPRYGFVAGLSRLAAAHRAPPGWELRVWAAIDAMERAQTRRAASSWWRRWGDQLPSARWLLAAVPVAALLVLLLSRTTPTRPALALELEVRRGESGPRRAVAASVGDEILVRAPGADAVWVYQDDGGLTARCPAAADSGEPAACRRAAHVVELAFRVPAAGRYRFVAIRQAGAVVPTGDLDRDSLALHAAGARVEVRSVVVPW